jgi:hypothetical protein
MEIDPYSASLKETVDRLAFLFDGEHLIALLNKW